MKFSMLPQSVGLLKLMLISDCTSNMQGREPCWRDLTKYTFNNIMFNLWTDLFQTW